MIDAAVRSARNWRHRSGARISLFLALICIGLTFANVASAASNPGDPLFCQPQEGVDYLIVNGGAGVFTSDSDCYGNNIANDTDTTLATTQGGTMTKAAGTGDYTYTPPTPGFTGLDTFNINVTTVWNGAGGTGSAGGTTRPGGPATLTITLNVLPATATITAVSGAGTLVPIPAGSRTGCSAVGNAGLGPVAGAIYGCVTGIRAGAVAPSHGTLSATFPNLRYTPTAGYVGTDTFTYQAEGVNNDGTTALNSGDVTVNVTVTPGPVPAPALSTWTLLVLIAGAVLSAAIFWRRRALIN